MRRRRGGISCAVLLALAPAAWAVPKPVSVVSAGPQGEVRTIEEANEVRVVFSEPMVALGKIPKHVVAPWFHIEPETAGTFRWSGTTTLIFRPVRRFPYAARYSVTIDAAVKSAAGGALEAPYAFSFVTPEVRLSSVAFYRENDRAAGRVYLILDFNQPVSAANLRPALSVRYEPRERAAEELPEVPQNGFAEWSAESKASYARRMEEADRARRLSSAVAVDVASDWDKKTYPPGNERVVVRTKAPVSPGSRLAIAVGGSNDPARTVDLPPAFFLTKLTCIEKCDPDYGDSLLFSSEVALAELRAHIAVRDVTTRGKERIVPQSQKQSRTSEEGDSEGSFGDEAPDTSRSFGLADLGYTLEPAHTYEVTVGRGLESSDGQRLGYDWSGRVEFWHRSAFASFGTGYGVWESSGGSVLPFSVRNLTRVDEWFAPVSLPDLVPTALKLDRPTDPNGATPELPPGSPTERPLRPKADVISAIGLDLSKSLNASGLGIVWTAIKAVDAIPKARIDTGEPYSTIVQVTNLGLSVKDSPEGTLVLVTRLDDGRPVAGAHVAIRKLDNAVAWEGGTDEQGVAIAPAAALRKDENLWTLAFFVTAQKGEDAAFAASNWNEGIQPWDFSGVSFDLEDAKPTLRGSVFADRGVYRLGEEVHIKAVLRSDTPRGIAMLPPATSVSVELRNSQNEVVDTRSVELSAWSSADWTLKLPDEAPLGSWRMTAKVEGQNREIDGSFLVASYRRPDFRVDARLSAALPVAGTNLSGKISARYLFGAPMGKAPVRWSLSRTKVFTVPEKIVDVFPEDRYAFLGWQAANEENRDVHEEIESHADVLDAGGNFEKSFATPADLGAPFRYEFEGDVTDVSRQSIAGREGVVVHPAPWYIGVGRPPYFVDASKGFDTQLVAAALDGRAAPGVAVSVTLTRVQWSSVRRLESGGFATWETERKEIPAGSWNVTTAAEPAPLHVPVPEGGYFVLRAEARDADGHVTRTQVDFYAVGAGYTAWQRYDHNRIDLVPEKTKYRPGDTARILIKSPWEKATALLTTEREGIRSWKEFELTSTQQTVSVPIEENDIPDIFVSVLLVRGRASNFDPKDASDPGKPSFRLGYARLEVADVRKRLKVTVGSDRDEYRPAANAKVSVEVKDLAGASAPSEVTLWAVDSGVLSLTGYQPPDLASSVYVPKSLAVLNEDSRQRIISRRVLTPKGAADGGGGGSAAGAGDEVRRDFRVLAFWLGSVVTDASGRATADVKMPESLTAYRIMAVAGDKSSRFGSGAREIRISKPVLLKAAFPRFLGVGDHAFFGAVVVNQLKIPGSAQVSLRSLDPETLDLAGAGSENLEVAAGGSAEARFAFVAKRPGRARLLASVRLDGETDAFQDSIPVEVLVSPEIVAAYGQTDRRAEESLVLPAGVIDSFGGLDVGLSSTALVGLSEGARYLADYPYGCAEQRASAALSLALASEGGASFRLPGIDPAKLADITRSTLKELAQFQGSDGGFVYWKGDAGPSSPYLTAYVLHVEEVARRLKFDIDARSFERAVDFLDREIGAEKPPSDEMRAVWTAWQAFGVKVLAEAGRRVDSPLERLAALADHMPLFSVADLADAAKASGNPGSRREELLRRIRNGILNEAGASHVEEIADSSLFWVWSSNVRTTARCLATLVAAEGEETVAASLVRWLLQVRHGGRWGNTQENAAAMEALVAYYRKFESVPPDFSAAVSLAGAEIAREEFRARSDEVRTRSIPMRELAPKTAGHPAALTFEKTGAGKLYYTARLAYAPLELPKEPLDAGISVERSYAPDSGGASGKTFHAGDLVRVTLTLHLTKERRFVAVTDPLPAGFEPVESWFATTASTLGRRAETEDGGDSDWLTRWRRGGFDHVERRDDRVNLFATRLSEGDHTFSYLVRATTSGTFSAAPARAEEMYTPEVFGRTAADEVEISR